MLKINPYKNHTVLAFSVKRCYINTTLLFLLTKLQLLILIPNTPIRSYISLRIHFPRLIKWWEIKDIYVFFFRPGLSIDKIFHGIFFWWNCSCQISPSLGHTFSVTISWFPARRAFGAYLSYMAMNRTDDGHPKRITVG